MGIAMSSLPSTMEEDMIRFIESDYFQSFIAEEVKNEVENRAKKKQKRRAIERCSNLWETNWGKHFSILQLQIVRHGKERNFGGDLE